jgi:hypothetical protein
VATGCELKLPRHPRTVIPRTRQIASGAPSAQFAPAEGNGWVNWSGLATLTSDIEALVPIALTLLRGLAPS